MRISLEQIQTLIIDAVQVGYMEAVKAYEPTADELKERDVQKWCKATFGNMTRIKRLMRAGVIKGYRKGDYANCALYYSKSAIKKALMTQRLSQFVADDELQEREGR